MLHVKEPHPTGIAPERQRFEVRECKAVHHGSLEPGGVVQMLLPVGNETFEGAINEAII